LKNKESIFHSFYKEINHLSSTRLRHISIASREFVDFYLHNNLPPLYHDFLAAARLQTHPLIVHLCASNEFSVKNVI
jgi:hypothetical protein